MREADRTTRERLADRLREEAMTPAALAREFDISRGSAVSHVGHVARSLEPTDEQVLVAPPTCEDCGFADFDDLVNVPGRCPECKSEAVTQPAYRIE